MFAKRIRQAPIQLPRGQKSLTRTQFAVIAWQRQGKKLKVCLVTSRRTGRWILPKGWPKRAATPQEAVAIEAWEEAGLKGKVHPRPLGVFSYLKRRGKSRLPVIAVLYAMEVTKAHSKWPEKKERRRDWASPKKAAARLSDRQLASMVARFDPELLD